MMAEKKFETGKTYMMADPWGVFPATVTKRTKCTVTFAYRECWRDKVVTLRIDNSAHYGDGDGNPIEVAYLKRGHLEVASNNEAE